MNTTQTISLLQGGAYNAALLSLYGKEALAAQTARYVAAVKEFESLYGKEREVALFSVPGRSELSGNHTDHNRGCVIATSVDFDIIAVASPTQNGRVRLKSEGFPEDSVELADYRTPRECDFGTSRAIIAGICAKFAQNGHTVGGFDAYTTSNVPKGSGLSSSAAFEDMVGNIENHFYNDAHIGAEEIAVISQYAENSFFGKPCGLMDQMACAVGGIIAIDFADAAHPVTERIDFDLTAAGYRLCIVNTGGNHADLTPDYAAIPTEMKAVAAALDKSVLREVDEQAFYAALPALRQSVGDRAILRAIHFFEENKRVQKQKISLQTGELSAFFALVRASGRSSFDYLQNIYSPAHPQEQGLSLALCLADRFFSHREGAYRVHGGGFAGTIQAFVKAEDVAELSALMNGVFGESACRALHVRGVGATRLMPSI